MCEIDARLHGCLGGTSGLLVGLSVALVAAYWLPLLVPLLVLPLLGLRCFSHAGVPLVAPLRRPIAAETSQRLLQHDFLVMMWVKPAAVLRALRQGHAVMFVGEPVSQGS